MTLSKPNAFALILGASLLAAAPALATDTCRWANDGECDDPSMRGAVSGLCAPGTDTSDCMAYAPGPDIGDICIFAHDNECDDPTVPGHLTSACAPGTDNTDCGIAAVEPMEPTDTLPFSDACPSGTVLMNGSCVDEDLAIEEEEAPADK